MQKKLFAALMALAAFAAFAVSATSASATTLTHPTGTKMAAGSLIKATNIGQTFMTNLSTEKMVTCEKAEMTGEIVNAGGAGAIATGNITASSFSGSHSTGDCTSITGAPIKVTTNIAGGLPYCMKTIEGKNEVEIRGGKCSEASRSIKFTLDATGIGTCGYEVASLRGTFTSHSTGDAIVTLSHAGPFKRYHSEGLVSLFCPAESTLDMSFTLERDEVAVTPIYIS